MNQTHTPGKCTLAPPIRTHKQYSRPWQASYLAIGEQEGGVLLASTDQGPRGYSGVGGDVQHLEASNGSATCGGTTCDEYQAIVQQHRGVQVTGGGQGRAGGEGVGGRVKHLGASQPIRGRDACSSTACDKDLCPRLVAHMYIHPFLDMTGSRCHKRLSLCSMPTAKWTKMKGEPWTRRINKSETEGWLLVVLTLPDCNRVAVWNTRPVAKLATTENALDTGSNSSTEVSTPALPLPPATST